MRAPAAVVALLLLLSFAPAPHPVRVPKSPPQPTPAGTGSQVQEIQDVQEVKTVTPVESKPHGLALLGRLHPALVHFPIAWVLMALILEAAALVSGRPDRARASAFVLAGAAFSFVPAAITGLLRVSEMKSDPEILLLAARHRNLNLAAGLACFAALALRIAWRNRPESQPRRVYVALVFLSAILLLIAGHLGGTMVFGTDYLPF